MSTLLDGQELFDKQQLKIELDSFKRDSVERAVPSLNGVLTIDLGSRGRKIKQSGTLRAKSRTQMNQRISAISVFLDGDTHTFVTDEGQEYENLRVDSFKVTGERIDGTGIVIDYEIKYTQLI